MGLLFIFIYLLILIFFLFFLFLSFFFFSFLFLFLFSFSHFLLKKGGGNITRRQEWFMNEFEAEIKLIDEILGPITPGICNKTEGPCSLFDVPYEAPVWDDSQVFRG